MWNEITLIAQTETVNEYGTVTKIETRRNVFADDYSVGMSEFYQAAIPGYKPEAKFRLNNWLDYHGEEIVEYIPFGAEELGIVDDEDQPVPVRFRVIRTYRDGEAIELTCQRGVEK